MESLKELDGRELKLNYSSGGAGATGAPRNNFQSRGGEASGDSTTVFVGNVGFRTTVEGLREFFSECGPIKDVRIAMNEEGRSKGFAHVEFETPEAAKKAIESNG